MDLNVVGLCADTWGDRHTDRQTDTAKLIALFTVNMLKAHTVYI
jgi:hypothetical protein